MEGVGGGVRTCPRFPALVLQLGAPVTTSGWRPSPPVKPVIVVVSGGLGWPAERCCGSAVTVSVALVTFSVAVLNANVSWRRRIVLRSGMAVNNRSAARIDRSLCSGLRIVEIGESVSAAVAGMVFADFGADVLIVEPPNRSRLRQVPAFAMWSRGKRSMCLDLTTTAGRDRVHELAADTDVMITALEPATADRFGVDGSTMCARNSRLVHCEVTGFGAATP